MGPKIAFFTGRAAVANQVCAGGSSCTVDFIPGSFDFNDGGKWDDGNNWFNADVPGAVYQYNLVLTYENATPGAVFQVFIRPGGGDFTRHEGTISHATGTVSLTATVKATGAGAGPIVVRIFSSSNIEVSRFKSQFSGHLVYAP